MADHHSPIDRRTVHRIVATTAKKAGIGNVHPHQLRHTLATQAINRGMRLEAIAALLGHQSMDMTLVYARIADRVVADEYASVANQIDALYATAGSPTTALPAEIETEAMVRLRQESHARMLGNGMCTRPVELDCRMESICETCAYFEPARSSCQFYFVSAIMPARTDRKTGLSSSTASLPKSARTQLDTDYTYNTG